MQQLTYLGPYPTIASLSLGVTRQFRLRLTPSPSSTELPRTYSVELPHNSLLVMHPPCQEHFKHTIPPQRTIDVFRPLGRDGPVHTERINITFRFYRPDFRPKDASAPRPDRSDGSRSGPSVETPVCHCGIPTILRADQCVHLAGSSAESRLTRRNNRKGKAAKAAAFRGEGAASPSADGSAPPIRFFWQCQAGQQNEGKGCHFFKFLDLRGEGRGPCIGEAKAAAA